MTHFIGAVMVPAIVPVFGEEVKYSEFYEGTRYHPSPELEEYLNKALADFDENVEVEPYETGSDWQETLAKALEWNADPRNEHPFDNPATTSKLVILTEWDGGWRANADGTYTQYSTYNPRSKWDEWVIGGRWMDQYRERQGETVEQLRQKIAKDRAVIEAGESLRPEATTTAGRVARNIDGDRKLPWWFPFNIVVPRGERFEWIELGRMGWWGFHDDEYSETEWMQKLDDELEKLPQDSRIIYCDFHI